LFKFQVSALPLGANVQSDRGRNLMKFHMRFCRFQRDQAFTPVNPGKLPGRWSV
jgi:hypothetical protein